ncbi:MAG TPA: 4'-phosphopantetheinyl transferase superfamily protein [Pyrinomonadaceae bacterium]|nr:4'-phosphopantetheinyl transferase superfamily protein [Pyrinomonadaceae bacterium]
MTGVKTKVDRESPASAIDWLAAPAALTISEGEVHVWRVDISKHAGSGVDAVLSQSERERAARFHFGRDLLRFRMAHFSLRTILGSYVTLPPAALLFGQTQFGKPFLVNPEADGLLFNMSHAGDFAVIAVAREREVGIDVELMRGSFASSEVAEQFFSVAEIYTLSGLHPDVRMRAFFNCWTRKEAYVKARGEGLSMPLDVFDVSLAPGSPAALLQNRNDARETSRWTFQDIDVAANYVAALAIETRPSPPQVSRFAYSI